MMTASCIMLIMSLCQHKSLFMASSWSCITTALLEVTGVMKKTLDLIQRWFTWTGIAEDVTEYVATCPVCQGKAVHCHKPYGQLEPLPPLSDYSPFKEISLDWITGLPVSIRNGQAYDSILTIVCHVTKYALFLPTWEDATAVDFTEMFFEHVKCCF